MFSKQSFSRLICFKVASIRSNIAAKHNIPVAAQKLIFKGKILTDDAKTVADVGMKDNDFMVLMVSKVSIF